MSFVVADRVQETGTVSTGTGTVNLAGAVLGYQSFVSGIGSTNTTYYTIYDPVAYTWEVGVGQVTAGTPNTLARTTVYANSAGTQPSKISFSTSDTLTVFCTYPAETSIYTGASASLNSVATTATISGSSNTGPYSYGMLSYSDLNIFGSFSANVNSYAQFVLQNTNNGTSASTDFIVSSGGGTATTNYGDFGMNSGGWTGTGAFTAPNNVYLTATSGDLAIGTTTSNQIRFAVNGGTTDALTISTAGNVTTPNVLTGAEIVASNGLHINSNIVSTSYSIASGNNAMSVGPMTVASGQSVTIPSGSRWVVL